MVFTFGPSVSVYSIAAFLIIFVGYIATSLILQYLYYYNRKYDVKEWKVQDKKDSSVGKIYQHPFISDKKGRGPYHGIFAAVNLFIASCFALVVTELGQRRSSLVHFQHDSLLSYGILKILWELFAAVALEMVLEYYWHRLMHLRFVYRHLHKFHHYYKSPEPFDDMYIHPLEAFGYYCILYMSPFVMNIHMYAFIAYMMVMGIFGIMDHSGIQFEIPWLYKSADHDCHHLKTEINYGFPFPYIDMIHGTYESG